MKGTEEQLLIREIKTAVEGKIERRRANLY